MFPPQISRLIGATILVVAGFAILRHQLVPESFGLYGHYRADAVAEAAAAPLRYGGKEACTTCHAGIEEVRLTSAHATVRCESCHGPASGHAHDPVAHPEPHLKESTKLCLGCHEHNPTRPREFPQIDRREHRPGIECVACHNPHSLEKVKQ